MAGNMASKRIKLARPAVSACVSRPDVIVYPGCLYSQVKVEDVPKLWQSVGKGKV